MRASGIDVDASDKFACRNQKTSYRGAPSEPMTPAQAFLSSHHGVKFLGVEGVSPSDFEGRLWPCRGTGAAKPGRVLLSLHWDKSKEKRRTRQIHDTTAPRAKASSLPALSFSEILDEGGSTSRSSSRGR